MKPFNLNSVDVRAHVIKRLRLDASAGQGVPEDVWLRLAAVLAAKQARGVEHLRPIQERQLRLARLGR
jgi:hypothetical protein